jgi:pimeloyl-ACP methyl ester carboxylesterase
MRCVADVSCAIEWITKRHCNINTVAVADDATRGDEEEDNSNMSINTKPALLGWSQGALVAQMYAQLHGPTTLSDLILFGSIYDPKTIYPRKPLYLNFDQSYADQQRVMAAPENANTEVAALEDFTLPGTICDEAASAFSTLALEVDPIKAAWDDLHEFNICNPALVHVPTMVMAGSQDPYVSWDAQRELFDRLGTEDKAMCILPGCDHAAHILKARRMFIRAVAGFLLRKDEF